MKQDDPQFKMRLPPELKARLEKSAKDNTRALGAEIVARLNDSYTELPAEGSFGLESFVEVMRSISAEELQSWQDFLNTALSITRLERLKTRLDSMKTNSERLKEEAKTAEDFAQIIKAIEQINVAEEEQRAVINSLVQAREGYLAASKKAK